MRNLEGVRGLSKKVEWVTGCLTSMIGMQKNRQIIRIIYLFYYRMIRPDKTRKEVASLKTTLKTIKS